MYKLRVHKFEGEKKNVYGMVSREERERRNVVVKTQSQKKN